MAADRYFPTTETRENTENDASRQGATTLPGAGWHGLEHRSERKPLHEV